MVIVRENVEDLYAGIEHMLTPDVGQCLKVISRKGSEKVIRYAFELARREGRAKVTCATKANIMKLTEGLFKAVFEELAPEYPEIATEHLIIDNVAHQLAKDPAQFDIVVTTNLNGDIISDLASGLVGGLGFASSGNYGDSVAIFEAVHGSAPKYAGKDVINPTALILSSVMMLRHLGEAAAARRIEDAVLRTLEDGQAMTQDLVRQTGGDVGTASLDDRLHRRGDRQPRQAAGLAVAGAAVGASQRAVGPATHAAARLDLRPRARRADRAPDGRPRHLHRDRPVARRRSAPTSSAWPGPAYRARLRREPRHEGLSVGRAATGQRRARPGAVPDRRRRRRRVDADLLELQARVADRTPGLDPRREAPRLRRGRGFTKAQGQ